MVKNLLFGGGGSGNSRREALHRNDWTVLVVDDEEEVHSVSRMILSRMRYRDRGVSVISAHSGAEAEAVLRATPDVAVILLDVVMETDDAGLRLVKVIRETLGNAAVRIILRTGQPGQAPEESVILDYDINDYKEKTELTSQKLTTAVITALRSYADIMALTLSRQGLEKVITACSTLFRKRSLQLFAEGILNQISGLLDVGPGGIICVQNQMHLQDGCEPDLYVLAASGRYRDATNQPLRGHVDAVVAEAVLNAMRTKRSSFDAFRMTIYLATPNDREVVVHFDSDRMMRDSDQSLIEVFSSNISVEFDNLVAYEQMKRASLAMAVAVAGAAEHKLDDGHDHGPRVARLSEEIASVMHRAGRWDAPMEPTFLAELGWASILHDLGKMTVPVEVLTKPGPLTPEERALVERHPIAGTEILRAAERLAEGNLPLRMAVDIVRCHHEHFDGKGYPAGLSGTSIPLPARVVAVADVFDSLTSAAPFREPWTSDEAVAHIRERSGTQFDPVVVEAFLEVMKRRSSTVLLDWSKDMSVGSPEMDRDHRRLIDLINQVAGTKGNEDPVIMEGVLDETVEHLGGHFAREEDLMRAVGFPGMDSHRKRHESIMADILALRLQLTEGFAAGVGGRLLSLLVPWVRDHIMREDKLYEAYVATAGGRT
ncbi:MAG: bacteriohemerythrin [Alphaproteobacteria bacterium]|nr:bacteriohemerythrin [Alphaproteobacteria bacterium]